MESGDVDVADVTPEMCLPRAGAGSSETRIPGPYRPERLEVVVEDDYVIVDLRAPRRSDGHQVTRTDRVLRAGRAHGAAVAPRA